MTEMNIKQALALINEEYGSDEGLLILFRLSSDVEEQKLESFIQALKIIESHYQDEALIEKDLVYRLLSFYTTLNASARHWKVNRPKGLTAQTVFKLNMAILDIFNTN